MYNLVILTMFSIFKTLILDIICCFLFSKCFFLNHLAIRSIYCISSDMRIYDVFINTRVKFFRRYYYYFEYRRLLSSILIFENLDKDSRLTTLFIRKKNEFKNRKKSKKTQNRTRDRKSNKQKRRHDIGWPYRME